MNIWIWGASGRMGSQIKDLVQEPEWNTTISLIGESSREHPNPLEELTEGVVIDFSTPHANQALLRQVARWQGNKLGVVIATTGIPCEDLSAWQQLTQRQPNLRVLEAPNTSPGVRIMKKLARYLAQLTQGLDYDFELEESHHKFKVDRPSGTALAIANEVAQENKLQVQYPAPAQVRAQNIIGMSVTRGGGIVGEHKLRAIGMYDEIAIEHRAFDRKVFAAGALQLAQWLDKQEAGFYTLEDIS
ncbi:MAG: 4-hydroxy-tetrahydrodipicolinate reductase [Zetaproteobacteria bacterium]|nr:4-hydroxy-tetrahydrodipicolinate reductase [Zetaproteobacteria bacterium]